MLKIIKHRKIPQESHAFIIQTAPTSEVTLRELEEYAKNSNIDVQFDNEITHIIQRVQ